MEHGRIDLRQISHRLSRVDTYDDALYTSCLDAPVWLSEHLIIAHGHFADGFFRNPFLLDIRTQHVTPLPGLEKRIQTFKGGQWKLSRDRRWILYLQGWLDDYSMVAVSPDGRHAQTWKVPEPLELCEYLWIPGTYRWLQLWSGSDSPNAFRIARLYELGHDRPLWERPLPVPLPPGSFLGYTSQGEALLANSNNADTTGRIGLVALRLPDLHRTERHNLAVGKVAAFIDDLMLSPDRRRIAFVRDQDIWTVGVDGHGLRRLGGVPNGCSLSLADWQPSTGQLTFHCCERERGYLYRLPYRS